MARVHYQKQRSQKVATKAHKYLESLYGEKASELEIDLRSRLSDKPASSPEKEENKDGSISEEDNRFIMATKLKSQNQASKKHPILPKEGKFYYSLLKISI